MKVYFDDAQFDAQLLRALAYTGSGGADIGECLTTAAAITPGNYVSWYTEWMALADRVSAAADVSLAVGRHVSAREAYLRACNYYRTAFVMFYGKPVDPRLVTAFDKQTEMFQKAAALMTPPAEAVEIPYEGTTLPGYLFRPTESRETRPTVIFTDGYDGTVEELYFTGVTAALARGYTCLTFDGPGQGRPLIKQQLYFRPDEEAVVTPVVDFALTRPEVDAGWIALMGRSWGGYLAPRAATAEHRLAACIADPGQYDPIDAFRHNLPLPPEVAAKLPDVDPAVLQPVIDGMMQVPALAWTLKRGMWTHGVDSPFAYLKMFAQFSLAGIAGQIRCPTLVTQAENDRVAAGAKDLYEALTCPKQFVPFTAAEGAGEHCEAGADSLYFQRVFDWLDGVLAAR